MRWTTGLLEWFDALTPFGQIITAMAAATLGGLAVLWFERRRYAELRRSSDARDAAARAEHAIVQAELRRRLEQLQQEHAHERTRLATALTSQRQFDPHSWTEAAHRLRAAEQYEEAAQTLCAGLERTRDALTQSYLELALHHYTLHPGLDAPDAARQLHEALRYARLACLSHPSNSSASVLLEEIETALESPQLRVTAADGARDAASAAYLGRAGECEPLLRALAELAAANERAGRFGPAKRVAARARLIALKELGEGAERTASIRRTYASTLFWSGAHEQALAEIEAALATRAADPLSDGPGVALRLLRIEILGRLERWESAIAELDALLLGAAAESGRDSHRLQLQAMHAAALTALGHPQAALLEIDAALTAPLCADAPLEPAVIEARATRAFVLGALGRTAEALAATERLLPLAERALGVEHRRAFDIRRQLAWLLHLSDQHDEALDEFDVLLLDEARAFGERHPVVERTRMLRDRVCTALGRKAETPAAMYARSA